MSRARPASKTMVEEGVARFNAGDHASALRCFERALARGDRSPGTRCFLAHCLASLGRLDAAAKQFSLALRAAPGDASARHGLAAVRRAQGRDGGAAGPAPRDERRPAPSAPTQEETQLMAAERLLAEALACDPAWTRGREEIGRIKTKREEAARAPGRPLNVPCHATTLIQLRAQELEEKGLAPRAAALLERAVKNGGGKMNLCSLQLFLADLYRRQGKTALQRRTWSAALRGLPPQAHVDRFRVLAGSAAYAEAFGEAAAAVAAGPSLMDLRTLKHPWSPVVSKAELSRHLTALDRAARSAPKSPWAFFYRGILTDSADDLRLAARLCRGKGDWMLERIGSGLLRSGRPAEGVAPLRAGLKARPLDWHTHAFLAEAYACLGRGAAALDMMSRGISAAPEEETGDALAWRGGLNLWLGRYAQALKDLETAGRRGAIWSPCWIAGAKIKLGRHAEALKDIEKALEVFPGDQEALVWRGEALRELGRHREALKDLDREPAGAWTLINRALARDALGDLDGMRRDFGRLLPSIVAHIRRRIGRRAGGDLDEAGMRRVLRSGLSFGLGYRREADYGNAIWMSLGTGSRKPGR